MTYQEKRVPIFNSLVEEWEVCNKKILQDLEHGVICSMCRQNAPLNKPEYCCKKENGKLPFISIKESELLTTFTGV